MTFLWTASFFPVCILPFLICEKEAKTWPGCIIWNSLKSKRIQAQPPCIQQTLLKTPSTCKSRPRIKRRQHVMSQNLTFASIFFFFRALFSSSFFLLSNSSPRWTNSLGSICRQKSPLENEEKITKYQDFVATRTLHKYFGASQCNFRG